MSLTAHRILQYIALILIFTAMAGGYWYWKSQAAVRINQGLEDSLEQGLAGYWKLDDASGTTATDSSGNGNNGTLTNGPTWGTGQVGGGVSFDGTDDYIAATLTTPAPNLTICSWVRPSNVTGQKIIVDGQGGDQERLRLEIYSGHFRTHFGDGTSWGALVDGVTALSNNNWYFACGVRSGSNTTLYVNGIRDGSGTDAVTVVGDTGIFIGRYSYNLSNNFVGNIDETRIYNRPLSDEEVKRLYQSTAPQGIDTGLIGYWPFDGDDISGITAYDRSGKGGNAILANSPTKVIGKSGQALGLNGSQYAEVPHQSYLNSYPLTVSTWFKTSSSSGVPGIVNKYVGGSMNGYQIFMYNGQLCAWYMSDGGNYIYDNSSSCTFYLAGYNDNNWHQATFVVDASGGKLYVDGNLGGSLAWTGTPGAPTTTQQLFIGTYNSTHFPGSIDETRIYNRALTAAEVQDLYQKTQSDTVGASNKRDSLALGLAGYWKLDDASGTTAVDSSTNGNNGTLTNGPTWSTGQISGAANFDGVNDYIDAGSPANLDNLPVFSASAWIYQPTASVGYRKVLSKGENNFTVSCPNGGWCLSTNGTELNFGLAYASGDLSKRAASVVPFDQWNHVIVTWDGTTSSSGTHMYVNGSEVTYTSQSSGSGARISDASWNVSLGSLHGGAQPFYGKIDETRIYNRVLTADEISRLYRTTAPTGVDTGLKGYWSFDQNALSGTTASDWSGAGNNGTLIGGPTKAIGKMAQALNFNGTTQYVSAGQTVASYPLSLSVWFKTSAVPSDYSQMLMVGTGTPFAAIAETIAAECGGAGKVKYIIRDNAGTAANVCSKTVMNDGQWHHAIGITSASNSHQLYVDGILQDTQTTALGAITLSPTYVGSNAGSQFFSGSLDEARVYNRALSVDEVREAYDYGKADKINTAASDPLADGLAGYWKLDDTSGTTATDSSGNGNNGTLANGPAWSTTGQVMGALSFDGVDDSVTVPYSSSLVGTDKLSYSFWIKPDLNEVTGILGSLNGEDGTGNNFITLDNNGSELNNPSVSIGRDIGGSVVYRAVSFASPTNTWIHGVYTYDGTAERWYINGAKLEEWAQTGTFATNTENGLLLGCVHSGSGGCSYKGLIDEVRVYKRALTTEDVQKLYRTTAPTGVDTSLVGYWPFDGDDFSGATTYDRSGKGNNGTLTNGPTKTIGKIGQALNFDGSNDYVAIPHSSQICPTSISVTTWVKLTSSTTTTYEGGATANEAYILGKAGNTDDAYVLYKGLTDKVSFSINSYLNGVASSAVLTVGQWHMVTGTYDGSSIKIYIDGNLDGTTAYAGGAISCNSSSLILGRRWLDSSYNAYFNGKIDEVRIHNRALTAAEIQNLYNKGR